MAHDGTIWAMKPLCIDLYCGLGGWAEGFLAEGYDVIGFDIEKHEYGDQKYPGQLVLQDVLDLDGKQFGDATVIVASPPCTEPSYRAMPWKRAKALNVRPPSNFLCLFYACFKIAHDAGVPVIVENVRGAECWVGPAAWKFGSYYLWGDIPALMPITVRRNWKSNSGTHERTSGPGRPRFITESKVPGQNWSRYKETGETSPHWRMQGIKVGGSWFGKDNNQSLMRCYSSHSKARKQASALIAKIPFPLANHIARCFL
jgi:hypothetical protein